MPDPTQLGPDDLAAAIRKKYPGKYIDTPNKDLVSGWLQKYPAYWKNVDAAKFEKLGLWQPSHFMNPTESTGQIMDPQTGKPRGESMMGKNMDSVVGAASPILATVGALGGGALAGPPGAVAGAAYGGFVGEGIKRDAEGQPRSATAELGAGALQGGMEFVGGQVVPKILQRVGKAAVPKVLKAMNNYIGLKATSLPKWARTVKDADEVSSTVLGEAGVKRTLQGQRDAIETARLARDLDTQALVKAQGGKLDDAHAIARYSAKELLADMKMEVHPKEAKAAVLANQDSILQVGSAQKNPEEMFDLRKSIGKRVTDWNPEEADVKNRYLIKVYHELNGAIERTLPPKEAAAFRANNFVQNRLIIARNAADKTILGQAVKKTPGLVTSVVNRTGGALIGAGSGTIIAGETGQSKEKGAIIGGLIGAGLGSYGRHLGSAELPAADIAAQQALTKAAPYLARITRKAGPTAVRATQAVIQGIQSRPQNQP